jgi:ribosomal protein S18 acetylase RimI-like enzyme
MNEKIEYKQLTLVDINENLLDNFNRYQKVIKSWQNIKGDWSLIDFEYIVDWDKDKKNNVIKEFLNIIENANGYIFGAYLNEDLIGFSVLLNKKFGTNEQYIRLKFLHVSLDYRNKGLGRKLFELCAEKTKEIGVKKIYIGANDSEETQKFYIGLGCKDALEINPEIFEEEPYDRQMEYIIKW